jgi:AacA4 family aminoglycoside N(6')-acetyltransferase
LIFSPCAEPRCCVPVGCQTASHLPLTMDSADPSITFRPLREADLPLLTDWLNRGHILEWWAGDDVARDIEYTRKKYLPRMDEASPVRAYIAMREDEPIGFIQSYVALGCGDGWWEEETDPGVRGIDQFLCDSGRLGQGLGTRMISAFVQRLLAEPGVTKVQTDPNPANVRAVRCYEKVGFRPVRRLTTPDGPALLMVVEKVAPREHTSAA